MLDKKNMDLMRILESQTFVNDAWSNMSKRKFKMVLRRKV